MPKEAIFERSDGTEIPLVPEPYCKFCSRPIPDGYADWGRCYDCNSLVNKKMEGVSTIRELPIMRPYNFAQAGAVGLYVTGGHKGIINGEIWALKNSLKGARSVAPLLAEVLEHVIINRYPSMLQSDMIVPVPPGDESRGFNQSAVLARELHSLLPGMRFHDVLRTAPSYRSQQQTESAEERWNNPRGKILLAKEGMEEVEGQAVLLIDDTLVMCATTDECAKVLTAGGGSVVHVAIVGRAISPKELEFIGYTGRY